MNSIYYPLSLGLNSILLVGLFAFIYVFLNRRKRAVEASAALARFANKERAANNSIEHLLSLSFDTPIAKEQLQQIEQKEREVLSALAEVYCQRDDLRLSSFYAEFDQLNHAYSELMRKMMDQIKSQTASSSATPSYVEERFEELCLFLKQVFMAYAATQEIKLAGRKDLSLDEMQTMFKELNPEDILGTDLGFSESSQLSSVDETPLIPDDIEAVSDFPPLEEASTEESEAKATQINPELNAPPDTPSKQIPEEEDDFDLILEAALSRSDEELPSSR